MTRKVNRKINRKVAPTQLPLVTDSKRSVCHGGELGQGIRKTRRPVDTKRPMHLVFQAKRNRGPFSLLSPPHALAVGRILMTVAGRHQVRVLEWTIVGNQVHLLVSAQTREGFANFLRRFSCEVALHVTRARKGKAFGRFWTGPAFSRIVESDRALETVRRFIALNPLEGLGTAE